MSRVGKQHYRFTIKVTMCPRGELATVTAWAHCSQLPNKGQETRSHLIVTFTVITVTLSPSR